MDGSFDLTARGLVEGKGTISAEEKVKSARKGTSGYRRWMLYCSDRPKQQTNEPVRTTMKQGKEKLTDLLLEVGLEVHGVSIAILEDGKRMSQSERNEERWIGKRRG